MLSYKVCPKSSQEQEEWILNVLQLSEDLGELGVRLGGKCLSGYRPLEQLCFLNSELVHTSKRRLALLQISLAGKKLRIKTEEASLGALAMLNSHGRSRVFSLIKQALS